jgi:L-serine/L-threonine ammonia-lyase
MPLHIVTPTIESIPLGKITGKRVYLKLECVQPTGSFKIRGIGKLCEELFARGRKVFVCPSSGNAGYSMAWAARELGAKAVVVGPESTPVEAREAIVSLGAEMLIHGKQWDESNQKAIEMAKQDPDVEYLSSYDDPLIWEGHSTMIDEMYTQCAKPDVILLSIGGGGMMSGVIEGLDRAGWSDVPVIGCGTYGANAFAASMEAEKLVRLPKVDTLVGCISAAEITPRVMELSKTHRLIPYLTSDLSCVEASERFLDDHRLLVDISCGLTLSALYQNSPLIAGFDRIAVIVCGGVVIRYRSLMKLKEEAKRFPAERN